MAKKSSTKKDMKNKDDEAKKKADDLFNDVMVSSKPKAEETKKEDVVEVKYSNKGNDWLETQVQTLSEKVEELEEKLAEKTLDYQKLFEQKGSSDPQSDSDIKKQVKNIFEELRTNYEGLNASRTRYADVKIKILLEKFLKSFPFLLEGKKAVR